MSDIPTPRTDAISRTCLWMGAGPNRTEFPGVPSDFSRTIERELNAAQQRIAELETACDNHFKIKQSAVVENVRLKKLVTELEQDKARLEHVITAMDIDEFFVMPEYPQQAREFIDNAMKGTP